MENMEDGNHGGVVGNAEEEANDVVAAATAAHQQLATLIASALRLQDALRPGVVVAATTNERRTEALLAAFRSNERRTELLLTAHRALHNAVEPDVVDVAGGNEEGEEEAQPPPPMMRVPPEPERRVVPRNGADRVLLVADRPREAVNLLEDVDDGRHIFSLMVFQEENDIEVEDAQSFPRFVDLLGQREVQRISLRLDWEALPHTEVTRLFHDVLPSHGTLRKIEIFIDALRPEFLRLLTENIPAAEGFPLLNFTICSLMEIDPADLALVAQAIVDMLNRDVAVEELTVTADLGSDVCRLICQAVPRCTNLRILDISAVEVGADTLDGLAASSLRRLHVSGSFSEDAVLSLSKQLSSKSLKEQMRSTATLRHLQLTEHSDNAIHHNQALLDVVRTYNYTLYEISGDLVSDHEDARVQEQFQGYMRRNHRIDLALELLQTNRVDYNRRRRLGGFFFDMYIRRFLLHKSAPLRERLRRSRAARPEPELRATLLLPQALGLMSDLPALLFGVLKKYYVKVAAPPHAG